MDPIFEAMAVQFLNSMIEKGFTFIEARSPGWSRSFEEAIKLLAQREAATYVPEMVTWLRGHLPFLKAFVAMETKA